MYEKMIISRRHLYLVITRIIHSLYSTDLGWLGRKSDTERD